MLVSVVSKFPTICALSGVSIIGEVVWYSPNCVSPVLEACNTSIPSKLVLVASKVFVVPKSTWAFVSKLVLTSVEVKSAFVSEEVAWYSPTWMLSVSSDCKTSTEAKSFASPNILVSAWKSVVWLVVVILNWVSELNSFVVVSYWAKPSVEDGKTSTVVGMKVSTAGFSLLVAGYSP